MKIFRVIPVLIFVLWGGFANAQTVIFDVPSPLPSEERGMAWEHPLATVEGYGRIEFKDSTFFPRLYKKYEGYIVCDVSASATADIDNKLEIKLASDGTEIRAKTELGTVYVHNCKLHDENTLAFMMDIPESMELMNKKVKVEIEGFVDLSSYFDFDEYEAEGKINSGGDPKVKLELENGRITLILPEIPPSPCEFDCSSPPGGGGIGAF